MMKKRNLTGGICAAVLAAVLLCGCANNQQDDYTSELVDATDEQAAAILTETPTPTPTDTPTPTATATPTPTDTPTPTPTQAVTIEPLEITPNPDPDEGLKLIGEKVEGKNVIRKKITNATGVDITGFFFRDQWMEDWPDNMLSSDDVWKDMETRYLYYDPTETLERAKDYGEAAKLRMLVLFGEDGDGILRYLPLEDMSDIQLMRDDDVFYLKYVSIKDMSEKSTERLEKGLEEEEDQPSVTEASANDSSASNSNASQSSTGNNSESNNNESNNNNNDNYTEENHEEQNANQEEDHHDDDNDDDDGDDGGDANYDDGGDDGDYVDEEAQSLTVYDEEAVG
ncbi:MAG: hypothetical protein J6D14_01240 [Lachnospiraceae bacterium]|nr:hypothetical protein [Lachnospiraceae bacterium]